MYVNYGRAADFEQLKTLGVNCSGKIIIARYGKIYRGNKVCLIIKEGRLLRNVRAAPICDHFTVVTPGCRIREPVPYFDMAIQCLRGVK